MLVRVLIVEDDRDIRELIQATLEPDFECLLASNGMEAWQLALEGEPDLIISDILMPVMDGHEFVRRLRKDPAFNTVPVIFLSALGSRDHIRKGYELGATLYLTKPIEPERLLRNIRLFVEDHSLRPVKKSRTVSQLHQALVHSAKPSAPPAESALKEGSKADSGGAPKAPKGKKKKGKKKRVVKPDSPVAREIRERGSAPSRARILVVEDDLDASEMIKTSLDEDYEILTASDGLEAMERAARYKPDLFIVDGMLPKMTGYQLVGVLRRNAVFHMTPLIFISGKATVRDKQYVERLGVRHFMAKPFEVEELQSLVGKIVAQPGFQIHSERISHKQMMLETLRDFDAGRSVSSRMGGVAGPGPGRSRRKKKEPPKR